MRSMNIRTQLGAAGRAQNEYPNATNHRLNQVYCLPARSLPTARTSQPHQRGTLRRRNNLYTTSVHHVP